MNKYTELSRRLDRKPHSSSQQLDVEQEINKIYHAVGATCSTFEGLQAVIVAAFGQVCGGDQAESSGKLISIIGGVSSFNIKTEMLTQAINVYIHNSEKKKAAQKWIKLAGKASERRNDIAHGIAVCFQNDDQQMQAVLVPPFLDPKKGGFMSTRETIFRWDSAQIMDYCDAITRVTGNFLAFIQELVGEEHNPNDAWMLAPDQLRT